jgi:Concanavalin A-like lectin/glucanases superfamily
MRTSTLRAAASLAAVTLFAAFEQAACFGRGDSVGPPSGLDASMSADGAISDVSVGGVEVGLADVAVDARPDSAPDAAPVDAEAGTPEAGDDAADASPCASDVGLVGYWPFEEGAGTTTADLSGNGNAGTLTNSPVWTATPPPTPYPNHYALTFDGSESYVTMGNPAVLQITDTLSVAAWFQSNASLTNYKTVLSKWWSGGSDAAYSIYWGNGAGPNFALSGSTVLAATSPTIYNDGAWHFIAGTWDGTTSSLYIDGVLVDAVTPDAAFGALEDVAHPFDVATDDRYPAGSGDRFFPGLIDDVRVYNRPLTAAEVGALFNGACAAH